MVSFTGSVFPATHRQATFVPAARPRSRRNPSLRRNLSVPRQGESQPAYGAVAKGNSGLLPTKPVRPAPEMRRRRDVRARSGKCFISSPFQEYRSARNEKRLSPLHVRPLIRVGLSPPSRTARSPSRGGAAGVPAMRALASPLRVAGRLAHSKRVMKVALGPPPLFILGFGFRLTRLRRPVHARRPRGPCPRRRAAAGAAAPSLRAIPAPLRRRSRLEFRPKELPP